MKAMSQPHIFFKEKWSHSSQNPCTSRCRACFLSVWCGKEGEDSHCCRGGWDLNSMWLYSVKPARSGRWTLTKAEVALDRVDEVERIADWQLPSITCNTSQDAGWRGGGCWRESVHSLPEMSFCQPVPGGITRVINLSQHLSINSFFQGQVCLWHAPFNSSITVWLRCLVDRF